MLDHALIDAFDLQNEREDLPGPRAAQAALRSPARLIVAGDAGPLHRNGFNGASLGDGRSLSPSPLLPGFLVARCGDRSRRVAFRDALSALKKLQLALRGAAGACREQDGSVIPSESSASLVLVDHRLVRGDQFDVGKMRREFPEAKWLVVRSLSDEALDVPGLIQSGFHGVLSPVVSPEEFLRVVAAVSRGEYWFPRTSLAAIIELWKASRQDSPDPAVLVSDAAPPDSATLTPREEEVFEGLRRGLSNKEIARSLDVSPETIKVYVKRVTTKLQLRNRYDARDLLLA